MKTSFNNQFSLSFFYGTDRKPAGIAYNLQSPRVLIWLYQICMALENAWRLTFWRLPQPLQSPTSRN